MFHIVLPLLATVIFAVKEKHKVWVALAIVTAGAVCCLCEAVSSFTGAELPGFIAGAAAPDRLSAIFMTIFSMAAPAVVLYSRGYLEAYRGKKSTAHMSLHYFSIAVLYFSMVAVVKSPGGYDFLFWWELMTISSFLLILFDAERKEVRRAALNYLIMMHVGFMFLLAGWVTLSAAGYEPTFRALAAYCRDRDALGIFMLFLVGFGVKAGIFPLHVWLPEAHPAAPAHISALMSGVMIKTGVYGTIRVVTCMGADNGRLALAGMVILGIGIVTGLWGVILATVQNDIKRLLAYSSIENIGVIFIGIGLAATGGATGSDTMALCGMAGALLHTANHSFFKTLLFFGAGNIYSKTHTTSLDSFGGLARSMPVTAILFLTGTAAICALPPLNGFVSEFMIYYGMIDGVAANQGGVIISVCGIVSLAFIGGLVVLAFTKLYGMVFLGAPRSNVVAEAGEVDGFRIAACALPTVAIVATGVLPMWLARPVMDTAAALTGSGTAAAEALAGRLTGVSVAAAAVVAATGLLLWWKYRLQRSRTVTSGPTWGCGFTSPTNRMQYTGESYAEGLQTIMKPVTKNTGSGQPVERSEIFPRSHTFGVEHKDKIDNLFSAWWVELLHIINSRVMRLRTGKINHYVLFALLFLGAILILSLFNII